jgi:hypothetical protein
MTAPMALALWDVEDTETAMPAVRDMTVGPVSAADVREFARRYHYSGSADNAMWRWGLWHGPVLLGVVSYNLPTRRTCASVFGDDHHKRVWHMTRLAMAESAPRNSESRLIGGSLRAIAREHPGVWAVITFAAGSAGHTGYVYQATNAIYTGTGGSSSFYTDASGNRRATNLSGWCVTADRAASMGWQRHAEPPKHRYVYVLSSTKRERRERLALLRLPVLPYPKRTEPAADDGY